MRDLGTIWINKSQHTRWKRGELASDWARRYPELFDEDDERLVGTQGARGYHFFEWLGAIMLHHATGFHALIGKYEFANHKRKRAIVEKLLDQETVDLLRDRSTYGRAQGPDLLMFAPDYSAYFFCEVKGPTDRMSKAQDSKFRHLSELDENRVGLLRFAWLFDLP